MRLFFVLVGLSKLAGPSATDWALRLSRWDYPPASKYVTGGIEILAGLGLFVPFVRRFAAVALIVVIVGAFVTHLVHGEFDRLLPPLFWPDCRMGFILGSLMRRIRRSVRGSGSSTIVDEWSVTLPNRQDRVCPSSAQNRTQPLGW
jgi:uncharacterized membrane protein